MPIRTPTKPTFTKGMLTCTRKSCDYVEAGFPVAEGKDGTKTGTGKDGTKPERPSLVSLTTGDLWESSCQEEGICTKSKDECATCEFTPKIRAHERCKKACKIAGSLDKAAVTKGERNQLGMGGIKADVENADAVDAKGLGKVAAGIQAKCAAFTADCAEDDVECACPSEVSTLVKQHAKGRGVDEIAKKIHCCRDVGGIDVEGVKGAIKSKLTAYVESSREELLALAEQVAECEAENADAGESADASAEEASLACESFEIINEASEEDLAKMLTMAASMTAEDISDVVDDVIGSGAVNVAGSAVLVALAALANM